MQTLLFPQMCLAEAHHRICDLMKIIRGKILNKQLLFSKSNFTKLSSKLLASSVRSYVFGSIQGYRLSNDYSELLKITNYLCWLSLPYHTPIEWGQKLQPEGNDVWESFGNVFSLWPDFAAWSVLRWQKFKFAPLYKVKHPHCKKIILTLETGYVKIVWGDSHGLN